MQVFDTLSISQRLDEAIDSAFEKFQSISENDWSFKPAPEKWSRKEVLGHLIDSAANNHIRFVRAQLADKEFVTYAYEQNFFVSAADYQNRETTELLALWRGYNKQLVAIIKNADQQKLDVLCRVGNYDPVTLGFIMNDYVDHLNHHVNTI